MDWHGMLKGRVGRLGSHNVQNTMYRLVATNSQNCSAQDCVCICIYNDLHETLRLALFDRTTDVLHKPLTNANFSSRSSSFAFGTPNASQRRVDIQRIRSDPVGNASRLIVEHIRCDYFEIVICSMCERSFPIAVAECTDPGHVSTQLVIDREVAATIQGKAGLIDVKVVGVRTPPYRQQRVR